MHASGIMNWHGLIGGYIKELPCKCSQGNVARQNLAGRVILNGSRPLITPHLTRDQRRVRRLALRNNRVTFEEWLAYFLACWEGLLRQRGQDFAW